MAQSIVEVVRRIKADVAHHLEGSLVKAICREIGYAWRDRVLDPVTTIHLFLVQVLHGNVAMSGLRHLAPGDFTKEAYCQARMRLPLELFQRLLSRIGGSLHRTLVDEDRWRGHRTWIVDGSGFSMPDNPQLQKHFGQPSGQASGCGFPVGHVLALFHAGTGLLLRMVVGPLYTHDMADAAKVHDELAEGDILVGDRAFASFTHLALLLGRKLHGVFRLHQKQIVNFRLGRLHKVKGQKHMQIAGWPTSRWIKHLGRWDQVIEYFKPKDRPNWMSAEAFAELPKSIVVRELRYLVSKRGFRVRQITLVTTLLDPVRYSAAELAELYRSRWNAETNLRHLKQTLGMDVVRCQTVDGVQKELMMFALAYNLVRVVMLEAARRQQVDVDRISFTDAWRWLRSAQPGEQLPALLVNSRRPGRIEPRVKKRRPKQYPLMQRPRKELRKALLANKIAA
jgi:Transposase DDE domain